eukprot:TRINITY_DN5939_c0_g1_i2.p1 TRINITY_DN5939_c0_g1~~TRINITY_DN5939_c0_g1_i2.p1  ORF type:complete len:158 (-),score=1.80 TRINITY_DN5939_c0_g1_i2:127-600(-)
MTQKVTKKEYCCSYFYCYFLVHQLFFFFNQYMENFDFSFFNTKRFLISYTKKIEFFCLTDFGQGFLLSSALKITKFPNLTWEFFIEGQANEIYNTKFVRYQYYSIKFFPYLLKFTVNWKYYQCFQTNSPNMLKSLFFDKNNLVFPLIVKNNPKILFA